LPTQTKKITLDTAAIFFGKAVGLLFGVIRLNYLATYLGVASFGTLNFATYFCSLFQVLFDLGISQLLIRELARDLSRSVEFVGRVLTLKIVVAFVAGILVGIAGFVSHFDRITNWAVLLTTIVFAVNGVALVFLSALQAHRNMTLVSIANLLNDLLLSIAIILVIQTYPNVVTVLLLSILIACVNLAILFTVYIRSVGMPQLKADVSLWKSLLKESTPIAISSLGISTYTFIGPTILKYTRGDVEVGIYSAGYKLISILTLIPTTFTQVVYPIFSDFFANAKQKLEKALQDSLRVMLQISVPLAIGMIVLAPRIIGILYPSSFTKAAPVLQLVIAGNAVGYLAWILYTFLLALNRQKFCMWNSLVVALTALVASLIAIPRFGFMAVAAVSLATDVALFLSLLQYTVKIGFRIDAMSKLLRIVLSAAVMGVLLFLLREWYLVPVVVVGSCTYVGMLLLLGVLGDQERELLAKVLKR
jgi:O-antigen/teichoic acid export membrane protein